MNNLYGLAMSNKLPVDGVKWVENTSQLTDDFIKNCNEDSYTGYFPEFDAQYSIKLHETHKDLPFLPEKMKIGRLEKVVCSLNDKKECVIHIRTLK